MPEQASTSRELGNAGCGLMTSSNAGLYKYSREEIMVVRESQDKPLPGLPKYACMMNKPATPEPEVVNPFESYDVTVLRNSSNKINTKDIQTLALHYIGCPNTPPDWCLVTNRGLGNRGATNKVCVVMVEAMYPTIYKNMKGNMPNMTTIFPDGPLEIQNPGSGTFVVPASSAILEMGEDPAPKKRSGVSKTENLPPVQDYILTKELRLAHGYPDIDVLDNDDGWTRFTGKSTVEAPSAPLYALDCEMCETSEGDEATHIAIIDESLERIYTTYIKPLNAILDYRTKYSGVTPEILENVTTTRTDVIKHINKVLPTQAIFIGQSLEHDLDSLKLYHDRIIDTAIIYDSEKPRKMPGLGYLAKKHLKADIQFSESGHDPCEDARTCMELVKLKVSEGPQFGIKHSYDNSLSVYLTQQQKNGVLIDRPNVVQHFCHGLVQPLPAWTDKVGMKTLLRCMSSPVDFLWLHLYTLEKIYRAGNSIEDMENNTDLVQGVNYIDAAIKSIYDQLPGDTLLMVFSGCNGYWMKPELNGRSKEQIWNKEAAKLKRGLLFIKVKKEEKEKNEKEKKEKEKNEKEKKEKEKKEKEKKEKEKKEKEKKKKKTVLN